MKIEEANRRFSIQGSLSDIRELIVLFLRILYSREYFILLGGIEMWRFRIRDSFFIHCHGWLSKERRLHLETFQKTPSSRADTLLKQIGGQLHCKFSRNPE